MLLNDDLLALICLLAVWGVLAAVKDVHQTGWHKMSARDKLLLPLYPIIVIAIVLVWGGLLGVVFAIAAVACAALLPLYFMVGRPLMAFLQSIRRNSK